MLTVPSGALSALIALPAFLLGPQQQQATPAPTPPVAPVFAPPSAPLDERIDASKITAQSLPRLPEPVAQPLRVFARIATAPAQVPMNSERFEAARAAIARGLAYLRSTQRPSGAWMEREAVQPTDQPRASSASVAVTAMGARAFLQAGVQDEASARAMDFVLAQVRAKGYDGLAEGGVGTYTTSAVLSALALSGEPRYGDEIRAAIDWLKGSQWDQSEGVRAEQDWFGGAGYGRNKRPDLSNTQLMLDALHDAGVSPDDPAVQKALAFVSRAQNLPASNDAAWARTGATLERPDAPGKTYADGGFIYTPANGGESFASEKAGEGRFGETMPPGHRSLRSYGSMTYAGFKSMVYAGLSRDDDRVKAAFAWIAANYTFDQNPGLGQDGLYYYYYVMSRALLAGQQNEIPAIAASPDRVIASDATAKTPTPTASPRNWRDDLVAAILARQRPDGSWVNDATRWEEGNADLVTIYAILALEEALKPVLQVE
jgi:squalene-hopene/tetraprenyl-beta-curcumene cyclase